MGKELSGKKITKNVFISIATQLISLALSFVMYMVVPKFISEIDYAYWQTFVLYATNVTVLHFGLVDGIALRYAKYDYNELDKKLMRSQFTIMFALTVFFASVLIVTAFFATEGVSRILCVLIAASIITRNIVLYSTYTLQITNRISRYAAVIIAQKLVYGIIAVWLLMAKVGEFYWYCIADLIGDLTVVVVSPFVNKGMYLGKTVGVKETFSEAGKNVASGALLLTANYSAMLLTAGAKMIIQWRFDELTFGKVSFAFSVTNLFLTFVMAVSVVLFPSLKRMEEQKLSAIYKPVRETVSLFLFWVLILYFPGCMILSRWLPKYTESLPYLGILMPLMVFSSKVSLLTNNYLKVYRKEKLMLILNLCSAAAGVAWFVVAAYLIGSVTAVLIGVVAIIMINSVLSEYFVCKITGVKLLKDFVSEFVMCAGFIVAVKLLPLLYAFAVYAVMLVIYSAINYKYFAGLFGKMRKRKNGAGEQNRGEEPEKNAEGESGEEAEEK